MDDTAANKTCDLASHVVRGDSLSSLDLVRNGHSDDQAGIVVEYLGTPSVGEIAEKPDAQRSGGNQKCRLLTHNSINSPYSEQELRGQVLVEGFVVLEVERIVGHHIVPAKALLSKGLPG